MGALGKRVHQNMGPLLAFQVPTVATAVRWCRNNPPLANREVDEAAIAVRLHMIYDVDDDETQGASIG